MYCKVPVLSFFIYTFVTEMKKNRLRCNKHLN
jgi:hypothetical protein